MTDHTTGGFYSRGLGKGALLRPGATNGVTWISPTTGKSIEVKEARIKSADVMNAITKCVYNKRSKKHLKPASVIDIIGTIRSNGRNSTPVLAVKLPDQRFEVIAGMRRSYAVSLCENAELIIHYTESMSEDDKRILARTADTYETPSLLDFGLTLLEFKEQIGSAYSVRVAAEAYGVNKTMVNDAERAASLPEELLNLFPGLGYISRTFLRLVSSKDISHDDLRKVVEKLSPVGDLSQEQSDDPDEQSRVLKASSEKLERAIISLLKLEKSLDDKKSSIDARWSNSVYTDGIDTKVTSKAVTIKLSSKIANSELGQALLALLAKQN